ncbi:MAG TPA: NAD(P)/FAD-dependent oxidoreductase [Acidobacteriota bacterium]|nr:NAD(P)/FAD-dependent oxidoreductase [Acidobacteriota bacterium]
MDSCDVLIVGGGPAGSSCAWKLTKAGASVTILDKAVFPRDKVCGGWITPQVLQELEIDPEDYSKGKTLQPITAFQTACMGRRELVTRYSMPVSFGIRRYEFDDFLLRRSGARVMEGTPLSALEHSDGKWIANRRYSAPLVVGAGGHFCPVARSLGAVRGHETVVAAQEVEFLMDARQRSECAVKPEAPELYFCEDMKGYGWCFRKGDYLNVGLGRLDRQRLTRHVADFCSRLKAAGRIPHDSPDSWPGHAYLLYGISPRSKAEDGVLLIGDSAGVAYAQSGEGIRPAVESGLLAAEVILHAKGDYRRERLRGYSDRLIQRFGKAESEWTRRLSALLPGGMAASLARGLLATHWFSRRILLDRWFLHAHIPALTFSKSCVPSFASSVIR